MEEYFMDLHLHIGRTNSGQGVKITASDRLTIENIISEGASRKGIDILGIVDAASSEVIKDIEKLVDEGKLIPLEDGGLSYQNRVTLILGSELEVKSEAGRQAHLIGYFPYLEDIKTFSQELSKYVTNINLSTQMTYLSAKELFEVVDSFGGILIPAHCFTPHRGLYGNYGDSLVDIFGEEVFQKVYAIELGLSADSELADYLNELGEKTFLSNSDAHSLAKIGREYNKVLLEQPTFKEVLLALKREQGRRIIGNYGLEPRLGKYYRSYCLECEKTLVDNYPALSCFKDSEHKIVKGVLDKVLEISSRKDSFSPDFRPEYHHQVPLVDIPGVGKKTLEKLLKAFGTEMEILHKADHKQLAEVVGQKVATNITRAREGKLSILPGGGGKYGKVIE
jgi:uncharacterized protein (TIGR00375 family)